MSVLADPQPTAEEQDLVERWQRIQELSVNGADATAMRPGWFADANRFLRHQEHWWCRHGSVTQAMAETLQHGQQTPVQVLTVLLSTCSLTLLTTA
jgi:hypothetical protein